MKSNILIIVLTFMAFGLFSQTPESINYQAVIRNSNGNILDNASVGIQFRVLSGSATGSSVYVEQFSTISNEFGLVNLQIGQGTAIFGVFSDINWGADEYFLEVGIDETGGSNYTVIGASQLLSVPYALHSKSADFATNDLDTDPTNEIQIFKVIGDTITLSNGNAVVINNIPGIDDQTLSLQNDSLLIEGGNGVDLSSYLDNTDEQVLSISNDTVYLSNGGFIKLPSGIIDTDDQVLSLSDDTLFLQDGGYVILPENFSGDYNDLTNSPSNLSDFSNDLGFVSSSNDADADSTNELQLLSLSGDTVYLTDGGFIVLPSGTVDTDDQNLSISNDSLIIQDGNKVDLSDYLDNTDAQVLSINDDTVFLSNGGYVILPENFSGDYNDLTNPPSNLSDFSNDLGFITNPNDLDSDTTNELQLLSLSGDTVYLTDGGFIVLPSGTIDTDDQNLSISNDSLIIQDGNKVDLSDYLDNTDAQVLSINDDTVFLSNGGYVVLPENFSGDYNDLTNTPANLSDFSNDLGFITSPNDLDADSTNELQLLSLSGDTVYLTDGGFIVLPSGTIDTDDQNLSISNDSLIIQDGNKVDLSDYLDNTDAQVLSINDDTVFLSNGGYVILPENFSGDYNDLSNTPGNLSEFSNDLGFVSSSNDADADSTNELQLLSLSGDTVYLTDGGFIVLPSGTIDTDDQNLSISNDSLIIQDGNKVDLSVYKDETDTLSLISDADNDTKIQVEESADEDIIRFDVVGTERWVMTETRLEPANTGRSIFIGENAGNADDLSDNSNVFIGSNAGAQNTSGNNNIAFGENAMSNNETGIQNLALGTGSQLNRQSGNNNISLGVNSMMENISGHQNVSMGVGSLRDNESGIENVAIGSYAGRYNISGSRNVFIGHQAGENETGSQRLYIDNSNTANPLIYGEFDNNIIGLNGSLGVGTNTPDAPLHVFSGSAGDVSGIRMTAGGGAHNALIYMNSSSDLVLRKQSNNAQLVVDAGGGVGVGTETPQEKLHVEGSIRMVDGNQSAGYIPVSDANGTMTWTAPSSLSGVNELVDDDGDTKIQVEETADEDIIRFDVDGTERWVMTDTRLEPANTGGSVFIGLLAGSMENLNDKHNIFIGSLSGTETTSGYSNVALGENTLTSNKNGYQNIAIGSNSQSELISGSNNISLGVNALKENTNGDQSIALGVGALRDNETGNENVAIGTYAGRTNVSGSRNIFIGQAAGENETGSDRLYIDNSNTSNPLIYGEFDNDILNVNGKLGVGTASPDKELSVIGVVRGAFDAAETEYVEMSHGGGNGYINTVGDGHLQFRHDGNTRMTIASNGFVGIGAGAPGEKLHVIGSIRMKDGNEAVGYIPVSDGNGTMTWTDPTTITTGNDGDWAISGNDQYSSVSGNVGIGTTSPTEKLDVDGNAIVSGSITAGTNVDAANILYLDNTNGTGANPPSFRFDGYQDKLYLIAESSGSGPSTGTEIRLRTATGSGIATDRMTINNVGNVGIGTTNPTKKLDILNGDLIVRSSNVSSSSRITVSGGRSGGGSGLNSGIGYAILDFDNYDGSGLASIYTGARIESQNQGAGSDDGDLRFYTANNGTLLEAMRIDEGGNIGLGVASPSEKLHIAGSIRMVDGNQSAGYIPVSDASGTMTWTDPANIATANDGDWTVSGNDVYSSVPGNVGIGINTPDSKLHLFSSSGGNDSGLKISTSGSNALIYTNNANDLVLRKLNTPDQLVLDALGNVGIGTSSPTDELYVANPNGTSSTATFESGSFIYPVALNVLPSTHASSKRAELKLDDWSILQDRVGDGTKDFAIYQISTTSQRFNIDVNGNVGIGDESPDVKLDVHGSIQMVDGNQSAGYIPVSDANGTMTWTDPATIAIADDGDWMINGNDLYNANSGNIGIGTATPSAHLHVAADGGNQLLVSASSATGHDGEITVRGARNGCTTCDNASLTLENYDNDISASSVLGRIAGQVTNNGPNTGDMLFYTSSDGSTLEEAMRLKNNGYIGIGTENPDGHIHIAQNGSNKTEGGIILHDYEIKMLNAGQNHWSIFNEENSGRFLINKVISSGLPGVAGDNAFTIDTSNNIGIGTSAPSTILSLDGDAARTIGMERSTGTDGFDLTIKAGGAKSGVSDRSGGNLILSGGTSTGNGNSISDPDSKIIFMTATPLGSSSSSDVAPSEKMRITAVGNVGIGNTNPASKVDIVDNSNGFENFVLRVENTANSNSSRDEGILVRAGHDTYNSSQRSSFIQFERPDGSYMGRIRQDGATAVGYITASDQRLKTAIVPTEYDLEDLMQIEVKDYSFKDDLSEEGRQTGFLAQQLYQHYPKAVDVGSENVEEQPWGVAYGMLTPLLVKSVQDLKAENDQLHVLLKEMQERIELLEQK